MSLRYQSSRSCIRCAAVRMGREDGVRGTTYVGSLCKRGHEHEGSGGSLRRSSGHTCVVCAREANARDVRAWARRHPERMAAHHQRYRRSERGRRTRAAWHAATREARLAYGRLANRRNYARRHGVVRVRYTLRDVAALFSAYDGRCAYCAGAATEVDHVVALTHSGHDALYNLAPVCRSCNARKGNRLLEHWYTGQPFFALERMVFLAEQQSAAGLPTMTMA